MGVTKWQGPASLEPHPRLQYNLGAMRTLALVLITAYQKLLSPLLPRTCRFFPSCSEYAKQAIQKYGLWRGGWLAIKRITRCHPGNPGGLDPVP